MSLPGADELFRTTGGTALQASAPRRPVPAPAAESDTAAAEGSAEHAPADSEPAEPRARTAEPEGPAGKAAPTAPVPAPAAARRRGARTANRRPSGRERHDEKITVYVSAEELMDLEHARLVLRGEHGLAVDRGRIVREAVAVVLADLESRGDASILVRRLRGR
ncbi:hypothetical protein PUR59_26150 [Streptomyces sp. SP18ES09]|uniref:hypothetical protein n=1 Tax=Streptomyces sp. SP18ES09 TaxID=3002532 RepID=UPI002E78E439|nr:hypothetical protein [Streptomyces sp. SP18ES09]MEE1818489.1 hypothetical protein [Streptomyces sp. SP18ES09]